MSRVLSMSIACALTACDTFESTAGAADDSGTGHIDASHIDANHMDAEHMDGGNTAPVRWVATKTTLDVWWPGTPVVDPGRADLVVYALTQVAGTCESGPAPALRMCGVELPPRTVDYRCEAYAARVANEAWDSPAAPIFALRDVDSDNPDGGEAIERGVVAWLGLEPPQVTEDDAGTPTPGHPPAPYACEQGEGAACFPDHDGDGLAGITLTYRNDLATYVGPYDTGECSWPRPYAYRSPAPEYICAGGICGPQPNITTQRVGLSVTLPSRASFCRGDAAGYVPEIDIVQEGCNVDLSTVSNSEWNPDPRVAEMNDECTAWEASFIANGIPDYRVLAPGEQPGTTHVSFGWNRIGRDIDRAPSEGTRIESITLHVDDIDAGSDGEPSCAQVRAVFGHE